MASLLDLNSDCSDSEDDQDYVPPDKDCSEDSVEENSDEEDVGESGSARKRSSKKKSVGKSSSKEENSRESEEEIEKKTEVNEEDEKKRVENLYKSFLDDVKPIVRKTPSFLPEKTDGSNTGIKNVEKKTVTVTEEYEFAGETVKVTKELDSSVVDSTSISSSVPRKPTAAPVKRPGGGLTSIIGALDKKKQKISTLQKSLLDWNNFKRDEGISEELETHNKGKDGYLERQAFLQRSDLRQFEIERNIRQSKRKP